MKESNHGLHFSVDVEVFSFIGTEAVVKVKGYMSAEVSVFLQEKNGIQKSVFKQLLNWVSFWNETVPQGCGHFQGVLR